MITIFSSPKSFVDPFIAMIQRNAIGSWIALKPSCQIILFGSDSGTAEIAAEFNLMHIPDVEYKSGKPLVRSLFRKAEQLADFNLLAYVNADIILLPGFTNAVSIVKDNLDSQPFLIVGQRCNVEIKKTIDFSNPAWEQELENFASTNGIMSGPCSIDYFVFSKNLWPDIPDFTTGRVAYDNWLIYQARKLHRPVVDITEAAKVLHQHHELFATNEKQPKILDQKALEDFLWQKRSSPEGLEQIHLAGDNIHLFTIEDANLLIKNKKIYKKKRTINKKIQKLRTYLSWYTKQPLLYIKKMASLSKYKAKQLITRICTKGFLSYNQTKYDSFIIRDSASHAIVQYLFWGGNFDGFKKELEIIKGLLQKRKNKLPVIFDIGASIGVVSMYYAAIDNSTIYSFEPVSKSFDFLRKNIELNRISNVQCFNIGLSDKKEFLTLAPPLPSQHYWYKDKIGLDRPSLSSVYSADRKNCRQALMTTIDEFVLENSIAGVDFVKIDVEGHEWAVIKGGLQTIKKHKPLIQVEINRFTQSISGKYTPEILAPLIEAGYELFYFDQGQLKQATPDTLPKENLVINAVLVNN